MNTLFTAFWQDEIGFVVSAEIVLVGTLAVLGVVAGLSHVRGAVVEEYKDLGDSFRSIDQSFSVAGFKGCKAFTAGSAHLEDCENPEIRYTHVNGNCQDRCEEACPLPCESHLESPCLSCGTKFASPCDRPCETVQSVPCESPCTTPCETTPCTGGCPNSGKTYYEGEIQPIPCDNCPTHVENHQNLQPLPAPQTNLNSDCCPEKTNFEHRVEYGPRYEEGPEVSDKVTDPNPFAVYNVRRYTDSPAWPTDQKLVPRSTVW